MTSLHNRRKSVFSHLRDFFKRDIAGGVVLILVSALALVIANSPLRDLYHFILNDVSFGIGDQHSIHHWINDGLMAIFFLLVGLEIKKELVAGALSRRDQAVLPFLAAIGGMVVPALIYVLINLGTPENIGGWAIPAATDIAFALCVMGMVGARVPVGLKILLMAIAIIDDLGAILIIAVFYGSGFSALPLLCAAGLLLGLFLLNRKNITSVLPYLLLGVLLWVALLDSGVHATLAGVVTALFVPLRSKKDAEHSPLHVLEHKLSPWVGFAIVPLFGFANAGVPFTGMSPASLMEPLTLGIALGLLLGKPIGIFTTLFLSIRFGLSPMPFGVTYRQLFAMSILCGIGFTMSLFIGGLAFDGGDQQAAIRLGVLAGSITAAVTGFALLRRCPVTP